MESCDKVSVTPSSCKDLANKCINKTLLTPCRSVGLKRKSSSLMKSTPVSTDSPIVRNSGTDSPTVSKFTPNSTISRKNLGCSIRDKLKKRKLDLSIGENDDLVEKNPSEDLRTKNIENVDKIQTDLGCSLSINSSQKNKQDERSPEIVGETSVNKYIVPSEITNDMILDLVDNIRKKELKLRSLEESHMYAKKHNPEELRGLIMKWKLGCQDALREIQSLINGKGYSMSMAQVLDQFQVPYNMVSFNVDCDEFED